MDLRRPASAQSLPASGPLLHSRARLGRAAVRRPRRAPPRQPDGKAGSRAPGGGPARAQARGEGARPRA
eukprot:13952749-Alexandrium_andersonii.AAC.1